MNGCECESNEESVWKKKKKKRNPRKNGATLVDFVTPARETKQKAARTKVKEEEGQEEAEQSTSDLFSLTVKDIDAALIEFLKKVKGFQDRAWKENPVKAKSRRRLVFGLREVRKQLSLEAVRCVVLARDIETDKSNEFVNELDAITRMCTAQRIDIFWVSSKQSLGKALKKWPIVSAVAVLDYRGAEDAHNTAMQKLVNFTACCRIANHIDQPSLFA